MNQRKLFLLILVLTVFIPTLNGCEKYALDRQMRELCEKDGGTKVYETVILPKNIFLTNQDIHSPDGRSATFQKNWGKNIYIRES